jgi:hypothetical protein
MLVTNECWLEAVTVHPGFEARSGFLHCYGFFELIYLLSCIPNFLLFGSKPCFALLSGCCVAGTVFRPSVAIHEGVKVVDRRIKDFMMAK